MKRPILSALTAAAVCAAASLNLHAEPSLPGQVDFGSFTPAAGKQFVEVNITESLITLATKFIEKQEPDVAKLLQGLHQVHVNVIGMDESNQAELEKRVQKVRHELESKGWEKIVTVQQTNQDVGVYLKTQNKDTVQGLVVVVIDNNQQAVFVNVVGDIKPEQLSMLGEKLHIEPLKNIGSTIGK